MPLCRECIYSRHNNKSGERCKHNSETGSGGCTENQEMFTPIGEKTNKPITSNKKRRSIMESVKTHFKNNQETYTILGILILLDFFVFDGKFSGKLESLATKMYNKVETKLTKED